MRLFGFIVIIEIMGVYSASQISAGFENESLPNAATNLVEKCFSSSEHWSMLLIISSTTSPDITKLIHKNFKTSSLVVSLETIEQLAVEKTDYSHDEKCCDYLNSTFTSQNLKPNAFIVTTQSSTQLNSILNFTRNHIPTLWNERSYLLVVSEGCNVTECNNMFKIIWNHWLLNAFILCSEIDPITKNQNKLELYTFNPYSADHSSGWKSVIREIVPVYVKPGNYNHSWYIFKKSFTRIESSKDCNHLLFEKTSNLEGLVVPVTLGDATLFAPGSITELPRWYDRDWVLMRIITRKLRSVMGLVPYEYQATKVHRGANGTETSAISDVLQEGLPPEPISVPANVHPSLGSSYHRAEGGVCFVSRIVGPRPQWSNIADAKPIWIGSGVAILFLTISFYLQNKSQGIVSAFLDSERLMTGSSVIHTLDTFKYRVILGSILLVVIVVDGTIRGRFISILTVVKNYPNFDTLEQLKKYNIKIYGDIYLKKALADPEMVVEYSPEYAISNCMKTIESENTQRACLGSCRSLPYLTFNLSHVHIASGPPVSDYVWSVSTLHTFFVDRFYSEMQKMQEGGLIDKIEQDLRMEAGIGPWRLGMRNGPPNVKAIKLNDILPTFMLLLCGLSAAVIAFVRETRSFWLLCEYSVKIAYKCRK